MARYWSKTEFEILGGAGMSTANHGFSRELGLALITSVAYFLLRPKYGAGKAILGAVMVATFGAILAQNVAHAQGSRADLVGYVGQAARAASALHLPDFSARTLSTLFSPALALAVLVVIEGTANARASALNGVVAFQSR